MNIQVGIPLGLVMFQSIGERLNKFASVVIRRAKCYLRCNTTEATEMNLMFATGMLSSIIITTGAALALQNDQALTSKPGYVALSLVFILFGLAVVAASINLLVLRFMTMCYACGKGKETRKKRDKSEPRTLDADVIGRWATNKNEPVASVYFYGSLCLYRKRSTLNIDFTEKVVRTKFLGNSILYNFVAGHFCPKVNI
ncbi:hypothetical protein ACJJTC_014625 [Scirpophaga incertulas]